MKSIHILNSYFKAILKGNLNVEFYNYKKNFYLFFKIYFFITY